VTAPALELLAELRREGLRLTPDGDQHLRIAPPEKLTPELRQRIVAAKPGLIAALRMQGDPERRIREMARRWQYTEAELAEALDCARRDPVAWLGAVELDEEFVACSERAVRAWPPERFSA
jgi:hypothetical protein